MLAQYKSKAKEITLCILSKKTQILLHLEQEDIEKLRACALWFGHPWGRGMDSGSFAVHLHYRIPPPSESRLQESVSARQYLRLAPGGATVSEGGARSPHDRLAVTVAGPLPQSVSAAPSSRAIRLCHPALPHKHPAPLSDLNPAPTSALTNP
jgi:hypothetical protein